MVSKAIRNVSSKQDITHRPEGAIESTADHDKLFKDLLTNGQATVRRKDGDVDARF